jgi:hypothetical protein
MHVNDSINSVQRKLQTGYPSWRLPSLDGFIFSAAGFATLLIGAWAPDPRLVVSDVGPDSTVVGVPAKPIHKKH